MVDQATQLKTIADNIEGMYQALRRAAGNIAGLLQAGRATCDEVRAYNLWALATYNTQRGMLATLRANGEQGVPELPQAPTLFTWRGQQGADAWKVDCSGQPTSLAGLMGKALKGPGASPSYLSTNEIQITTSDQYLMNPEAAPSFKTLLMIQEARTKQGMAGLGIVGILIAIAGIMIAVSVAIVAIMHYLEVNEVQEANTKQTRLQADAFANYTAARLSCYSSCVGQGRTSEDCTAFCGKLITKPDIKLPGQGDDSWGVLQWIGATVLLGFGSLVALKLYRNHKNGQPLFQLPELVGHEG